MSIQNFCFQNINAMNVPSLMQCCQSVCVDQQIYNYNDAFGESNFLSDRLYRKNDGTLFLKEKTIAEVVGEKLLRPLLDKVANCFKKCVSTSLEGSSLVTLKNQQNSTQKVTILP